MFYTDTGFTLNIDSTKLHSLLLQTIGEPQS
jgi:hypothetical protein